MTVGVVTGAASGMGRECVQRLLGTVEHLVAVDLNRPEIDGAIGVACDVSDAGAVASLAEWVADTGPFRALIHAAGLSPSMAMSRRIIDVNLLGTVHVLDAFEPLVVPGSAAVCFASSAAYIPTEFLGPELMDLLGQARSEGLLDRAAALLPDSGLAYSWSKKAVQVEVARAAVRWGPRGGRVVSVSPGLIDTPMGRLEFDNHPVMKQMLDDTPLGRLGQANELAAAAAFLVSDEASFISGIDLLVDGGSHAASTSSSASAGS